MKAVWIDPALMSDPEDVRERVREKVSRGGPYRAGQTHMAWKPERGDRVLKRLGLAPFASTPDPERFDPMAEPAWSLLMALAWIIWRSPDAVRDHWEDYRAACVEWSGFQIGGQRELGRRPPSSMRHLHHDLVEHENLRLADVKKRCDDAVADLMRELNRGSIAADGRRLGMERKEISPREWRDLRIHSGRAKDRENVQLVDHINKTMIYEHVEIDRVNILSIFPHINKSLASNYNKSSAEQQFTTNKGEITYRTGTAGRPTSKHILSSEIEKMLVRGQRFRSQNEAARELAQWLQQTHPEAAQPTPKTIATELGSELRKIVERPKTKIRKSQTD